MARRRSNQFTITEVSTNSVKRQAAAADVVRNTKYELEKRNRLAIDRSEIWHRLPSQNVSR